MGNVHETVRRLIARGQRLGVTEVLFDDVAGYVKRLDKLAAVDAVDVDPW